VPAFNIRTPAARRATPAFPPPGEINYPQGAASVRGREIGIS
jgi:hypothetical protein